MKCSRCNFETHDNCLKIITNGDGSKSVVCKDCSSNYTFFKTFIYWALLFTLVLSSLIAFNEYKKNRTDVIDVCSGQENC